MHDIFDVTNTLTMELTGLYYLHEIGGKKTQEDYLWPVAGRAKREDRIFMVCDGVGGSENGEIASRMICEFMAAQLRDAGEAGMTVAEVNRMLHRAQQQLMAYAAKKGLSKDMATTFTLLMLFEKKAFVAWCGDSRVYQFRQGEVVQVSTDHSLVNTLVQGGEITEEDARSHPQKNIILRAVKADGSPIDAEGFWIEDIRDGDYFLLCTDGILENIGNEEFRFLLNRLDAGNTDVVGAFQQYCLDKTRDNYSMYLLKTGGGGEAVSSRGPGWSTLMGLAILLAVAALFLFWHTHSGQKRQPSLPAPDTVASPVRAKPAEKPAEKPLVEQPVEVDSLPVLEKENAPTDSAENPDPKK